MTDLKDCPFCGSHDVATQHCDEVSNVCCDNCHAGYWTSDGEDAESIWNNRVSPWRSLRDDPPKQEASPVIGRRMIGRYCERALLWWCPCSNDWLAVTHSISDADPESSDIIENGLRCFDEWMEVPE